MGIRTGLWMVLGLVNAFGVFRWTIILLRCGFMDGLDGISQRAISFLDFPFICEV